MAIEKGGSLGKVGMDRSTYPGELGKESYTFALNAQKHNEQGDGRSLLQNEPSNVKCTNFKPGYRVVGAKYDKDTEEVYFFLHNPTTKASEIGVVNVFNTLEGNTPFEITVETDLYIKEETPLEDQVQTWDCSYFTLLSDECNPENNCLNFSLEDPIHREDIIIKKGVRGTTVWFAHKSNPQRYFEREYLDQYTSDIDPCNGEVTQTCLDCEKLRIFPRISTPYLTAEAIQNGGALRAGMYEIWIASSNEKGNVLSDFFSQTNPIPVHDKNNDILDQTNLGYKTNQAIQINVEGVDDTWEYFVILVVYRDGLDSAVTYRVNGVYPSDRTQIVVADISQKPSLSEPELYNRRVHYKAAGGLATSNSYLYQYDLVAERTINLQKVVNLMGSLARWGTNLAKENLYQNAIAVANSKTYMRDETYPYGIIFQIGGRETNLFPFIARPPRPEEILEVGQEGFEDNNETNSIAKYNDACYDGGRTKRWQFENTATELSDCYVAGGTGPEVIQDEIKSCNLTTEGGDLAVVDTIAVSTVITNGEESVIDYINNNYDDIVNGTEDNGADIRDVLEDPTDYPGDCETVFGDTCDEPVLISERIFPIEVTSETAEEVDQIASNYERSDLKGDCKITTEDENGDLVLDTTFATNYLDTGETVYKRITPSNNQCTLANQVPFFSIPQVANSNHLDNKGEIGGFGTLVEVRDTGLNFFYAKAVLTGTSGDININIDGSVYNLPYTGTSLSDTASFFQTTYAVAILASHTLVVTAVGNTIFFRGPLTSFYNVTKTNGAPDLDATITDNFFTDNLSTNAIWVKVDLSSGVKQVFEVGTGICTLPDVNNSELLRVSMYNDCASTTAIPTYTKIIQNMSDQNDAQKIITINPADFSGAFAYIALEAPIRRRVVAPGESFTLTPPCSCFPVYTRNAETAFQISYSGLKFGKSQTYQASCTYNLPKVSDCEAVPYKKGLFSYTESLEVYPCNDELYDSSDLNISPADIPLEYRAEFEEYYTTGTSGGKYVLKADTDFRNKGIRHFKYPDSNVAPFMSDDSQNPGAFNSAYIFPIGFNLDTTVINAFLDIAVKNGLLTARERNEITGYKIMRGDRRTNKTIISKGLAFDMYKYSERGENVFYPNYPLNAMGTDGFNGKIPHPFLSAGNNFFSYHSPDTSFNKPSLTNEIYVEGYLHGNSAIHYDEVQDYPKYVLLGSKARLLATTLAVAEAAFELLLQSSQLLTTAAAGGLTAPFAGVVAGLAIVSLVATATFQAGKYRYQWLQTFKNLGNPLNFAYYNAVVGYYNYFKRSNLPFQKLRALAIRTYLKPGLARVTDEADNINYRVNAFGREEMVLFHTGDYPIDFPSDYQTYDNSDGVYENYSSRRNYGGVGRTELRGNAASPYVSMKQYLPSQYGSIDSIQWLSTGFERKLTDSTACDNAFGGDVFISRFALKRKLPFFTSDSFGLASLTPFKHSDYFNINPEGNPLNKYYLDYELADDSTGFNLGFYLFPNNNSKYRFHAPTGESNFYIKPPSKFYIYSYGIPHFLVESEINCNYRYGRPAEVDNFYPNISDVIEWTQEKNLSIREPNTFFYNSVYSSEKSIYPYRTLPINYNEVVYNRLQDLSNAVIYSLQDGSETSLVDPWLRYRALDFYRFSKKFGDIKSIVGIESLQILVRATNGLTILGSIDPIREKLTADTGNLGAGGIFAARPVDFHTTDLGHAGTQHKTIESTEYGHFSVDAKRGKIFLLGPGGKGLEEISKGKKGTIQMEHFFKNNLPFQILKDNPNVDVDNNYNGIGLATGWDERLKRFFVTKKDYRLKKPLEYENGKWFIDNSNDCPEDFSPDGDNCIKIETTVKTPNTEALALVPARSLSYGFSNPALYTAYNANGTALGTPGNYTYQNLSAAFWTDGGSLNSIVNRLGKWVGSGSVDYTFYGGFQSINIPTTKTYFVFLAVDNIFRFSVDGVVILTSNLNGMAAQHGLTANPDRVTYTKGHIYPINLTAGCHTIKVEGQNTGGAAMFAAAIIDATALEIQNATTWEELAKIYSTENAEFFYAATPDFACPEDYSETGPTPCDTCQKITEQPREIIRDYKELPDSEYFEDVSWTATYDPTEDTWLSYMSFKPNYYLAYNDYFQTGLNYSTDSEEIGLWSHLPFLSSYQVFYGKRYPFIIEYPIATRGAASRLDSVEYWLEARKYYNKYNFADIVGASFNKAIIYNTTQNTGLLKLVHRKDDDMSQDLEYPKHSNNYIEILQTEMNGRWSFNHLYNAVIQEKSRTPVWIEERNNVLKELDSRVLNMDSEIKDYLRGDHFLVRLINDSESRYKLLFRLGVDLRKFYEQ